MTEDDREPHMRMLITADCNLSCLYCRFGGEGYFGNPDILLKPWEIQEIVDISANIWLKNLKVSGGEPFLRKDLPEILNRLVSLEKLKTIQLVTNGILLPKYYHKIMDIDFTGITISLDTIEKDTYKILSGKNELHRVLNGVEIVRKYGKHPITINCVITSTNIYEVENMIHFASEIGSTLKMIDLMNLGQFMRSKWEKYFIDFSLLAGYLENAVGLKYLGVEKPVGGLGSPQILFQTENKTKVLLRDGQIGTNYHESCRKCQFYPCHDALISMRITHNGLVKRCLIRDDNLVDILTPLRGGNMEKVEKLIYESYSILKHSKYFPHKWSPAVERMHIRNLGWDDEYQEIFEV